MLFLGGDIDALFDIGLKTSLKYDIVSNEILKRSLAIILTLIIKKFVTELVFHQV